MGRRRFLVAGVLLAGCGSAAGSAEPPATATVAPVATSAPSTAPTTVPMTVPVTVPVTDVAASPPATCADLAGGEHPSEPVPIDDWVVAVERLPTGGVRLVASAATGQVLSLGCMRGDAADASGELGLSLASVHPVAEGVRVAIAIPAGRQLVPLAWLEPRSEAAAAESTAGYEVHVFLATAPPSVDAATPSIGQLAGLVTQAFDDGTSTVAGLAPDILEPA